MRTLISSCASIRQCCNYKELCIYTIVYVHLHWLQYENGALIRLCTCICIGWNMRTVRWYYCVSVSAVAAIWAQRIDTIVYVYLHWLQYENGAFPLVSIWEPCIDTVMYDEVFPFHVFGFSIFQSSFLWKDYCRASCMTHLPLNDQNKNKHFV